ncbi:homeobox-DDT domain protein RLT2 [Ipomoea triloba]|uniref:homeobox-DDT domain protein RLT2 n=1 Tax=Ipomoea triloba TaxID=35885 RepID=UPI00125DA706|nr:homeobox-DDT domain protein RLT2 [Ipomoea triloba]
MEPPGGGNGGESAAPAGVAGGSAGGSGGSDVEKKKPPEGGEPKVKRKMKTASQLEILEKTYAKEAYPSEAVRAELSVKLGLTDRQLQMWFCHRRLKDRKAPSAPSVKRTRKEDLPGAMVSSCGQDDIATGGELRSGHASASASGLNPHTPVDLQPHHPRVVHRPGTAVPRYAAEMPAMKRYYEPPQAISELRAIAFVEAQLGEPLREDGPILGMEFDPLPPGAFGAPIVTAVHHKPAERSFDTELYERQDSRQIKGPTRTLLEYQFIPEQPSIRSDAYERTVPHHYYGSPSEAQGTRPSLSSGRSYLHNSEHFPSGYSIQTQPPTLSLLHQQGRHAHLSPASEEVDVAPQGSSHVKISVEGNFGSHPITGLENQFVSPETRVIHEEERLERKRKSEEAKMAREVEAHEKRIRKELEKQDMLRRKREEQMRKEMERQDRERRKEEERLLREKQREEERYLREQRREMERREKFLQKESKRVEKMKLKEEMRREKEAAKLKAANERAAARRIAKESIELIEDERLELMELAASRKGLPSVLALDNEALQNLDSFADMLREFPPKFVCLKKPFGIQPWIGSDANVGNLLMVWRFLITFSDVLSLWPFTLDELVQAFHDYDPRLLGEIHIALLRSIIKDIEDVARTSSAVVGVNQNNVANPGGGHPQIVEGAYAWGFDIRSWQRHLNPLTWPEILRQFALSAGFGPKLKKRSIEPAGLRDENEGNDAADIISNLRNGVAAENALSKMQERGLSNPRRSRHRLTPGTVKFAAFHVLSFEGSKGLTILDVAERIQASGLRDLTTSKTPEASIAAALSRDTKLFERTAPSTYCVRTPYRKDPADAEALLAAAREKVHLFKNRCLNGEEADDGEKDDVEREEDSESDAAEDPEVDNLEDETNINKSSGSCKPSRLEDHKISYDLTEMPPDSVQNSPTLMQASGLLGEKTSGDQLVDTGSQCESSIPDQENTIVDDGSAGEQWVQGLMDGEYSDLSVEERLDALVALVGFANEGNSIRIALEERLEAASALKKQMWAEAQLDKRRFKDDYVIKMQYSSVINKAEQNFSISAMESRQCLSLAINANNGAAPLNSAAQPGDSNNPNYSSNVIVERNLPLQEFSAGPDNIQVQHLGYVAEKSRMQLKTYIGYRAEQTYVYRSLPLGQDRRRNRYWQFITSSRNDPGYGRIFVELRDGQWRLIDSEKGFDALLASLDVRGIRESHLHLMLQRIEVTFKETARRNTLQMNSVPDVENDVKNEALEKTSTLDKDPNSAPCISNCDMSEPSASFVIGVGRNIVEKSDALRRYLDFEKWMWEECLDSKFLCAMKEGKIRRRNLLRVCDHCHVLYFEENHCPFCHTTYAKNSKFSEHLTRCKEKLKDEYLSPYRALYSSPPIRLRLLKAQLASLEVSVLPEAFEPVWSEEYRSHWGMKLQTASSAEDLLQLLTMLECAIKRDFLLSNYETSNELLGISDQPAGFERVGVLPWIPHTTAALALRLMELDTSIYYTQQQKEESQKGARNFSALPSKYTIPKNVAEEVPAEALHEAGMWPNVENGSGSGRGRGRGRGRRRISIEKSQRKIVDSKPESASHRKSIASNDRLGGLPGWKGQSKGQGGRRKGRRSARSRQRPVKNVNITINAENRPCSIEQQWKEDETAQIQIEAAENDSSPERSGFENDNGQASEDEYDDYAMTEEYPGLFSAKSGQQMEIGGNYDADQGIDDRIDDIDYANDDYIDGDDEVEGEEDAPGNEEDIEGYFNGDSEDEGNRFRAGDSEDEGNRFRAEEQIESESQDSPSSSSDYSE